MGVVSSINSVANTAVAKMNGVLRDAIAFISDFSLLIVSDDFLPANPSGLPTSEIGNNWSSTGTWVTASQKITSANGNAAKHVGRSNGFRILCSLVLPVGYTLYVNFCSRLDYYAGAGDDYYQMFLTGGNYNLYRSVNGTYLLLASWASLPVDGDQLDIRVIDGGNIEVWINGTLRMQSSDTTHRGVGQRNHVFVYANNNSGIGVSSNGKFQVLPL